jgi:N4-gp56 family major capsid protein
MAKTTVTTSDSLAIKKFSTAVFNEVVRSSTSWDGMVGPAPKNLKDTLKNNDGRLETSPEYPVVQIVDLKNSRGDRVSVDLFNQITGNMTMGDNDITNDRSKMDYNSKEIIINQFRKSVSPGGRMTQQRTTHNLRMYAKSQLSAHFKRYIPQNRLIHMAGARGDQIGRSWAIPLDTDPGFSDQIINPIFAPSFDRHFYAGGKDSIANLTTTDIITLDDLDMIAAVIDEDEHPIQPVMAKASEELGMSDQLKAIVMLTPRQYDRLLRQTTSTASLRDFQKYDSLLKGSKYKLLRGECGIWRNMLIKRAGSHAVRFNVGTDVTVTQDSNTYSTTTSTVPDLHTGGTGLAAVAGNWAVDRALIIGGSAAYDVFGAYGPTDVMKWVEGMENDDNDWYCTVGGMGGFQKAMFDDGDGRHNDYGVMVMDSVAPIPQVAL